MTCKIVFLTMLGANSNLSFVLDNINLDEDSMSDVSLYNSTLLCALGIDGETRLQVKITLSLRRIEASYDRPRLREKLRSPECVGTGERRQSRPLWAVCCERNCMLDGKLLVCCSLHFG